MLATSSAARWPYLGKASLAGVRVKEVILSCERWLVGSKVRNDSIWSPKSSMRTGQGLPGGKTSMIPPRRLKVPGSSTTLSGR